MTTPPPPGGFPPYPSQPEPGQPAVHPNYPNYPPGWAPPPGDPLIPTDLGGWFDRCIRVFRRSFWRLSLITLIVGAALLVLVGACIGIVAGLSTATGTPDSMPVAFVGVPIAIAVLAMLAGLAVGQGAMICIAVTDAAGQRVSIRDAVRLGVRRSPALAGWWAPASIGVLVGILVLIIPGVYLAVVFNASLTCAVVVERAGVERCFDLIKNRFWATFGRLVLGWLILQAYQLVVQFVLVVPLAGGFALLAPDGGSPGVAAGIGMAVIGALALALFTLPVLVAGTAITVVTYAELRGHELPGTTTGQLAEELGRARSLRSAAESAHR